MSAATSLTAYRRREKRKHVAKFCLFSFACALVLMIALLFVWRMHTIQQMHREIAELLLKKEEAEREKKILQDLLTRQGDLSLIEYLGRTELGLVRKGEIKYKVCTAGSPSSQGLCSDTESK